MNRGGLEGVLVVDKESGPTSHDVVDELRRILSVKKAGHTGTLDPPATGVLIVCLGRATKIAQFLADDDKEYIAKVQLGVSTDTFDACGRVTRSVDDFEIDRVRIEKICRDFEGEVEQVPPMFSAAKIRGRRLYELARLGETVERKAKKVTVFRLEVQSYEQPFLSLRVVCSKGTYIRSLAHDLGQALGCGAHVVSLRRIRVGAFGIDDALTVGKTADLAKKGELDARIIPIGQALRKYPRISLSGRDADRFRNGNPVRFERERAESIASLKVRVQDPAGDLCGVGMLASGWVRPLRVFR